MKNKQFAKQYIKQVKFISACDRRINSLVGIIRWNISKNYPVPNYIPERLRQLKVVYKNAQRGLSNLELEYKGSLGVKKLPYLTATEEFESYFKKHIKNL